MRLSVGRQGQEARAAKTPTRHWQTAPVSAAKSWSDYRYGPSRPPVTLSPKRYRQLLIIQELYRPQRRIYMHRCYRIAHRLGSFSHPHVRPIVRGKVGYFVEFGAKISVSLVYGMSFADRISWDTYNKSVDLVEQLEAYRRRFGHQPASVHVD